MLTIRDLRLSAPLLLAPMAGLTHSALRRVLVNLGGVGLLSTEMLSARRLPVDNPDLSPYLIRTPGERPLSYQLLVTDPGEIPPAMDKIHRLGADGVDLNFGCPAPRIRQAGGGSALMDDPDRVRAIVSAARQRTSLPLSAKIRLGERLDSEWLRGFCRMLEGEGVDLITVHARLRGESFARRRRGDWGGRVKQWLSIPVVANGGIFSVDDGRRCLELSGADGLMLGRGAAQKPWLFNAIAREIYHLDLEPVKPDPVGVYAEFVRGLLRFPRQRRLGRLKEFSHYLAVNYAFGHHLAMGVQKSRSMEEAWATACDFFRRADPDRAAAAPLDELTGLLRDRDSGRD